METHKDFTKGKIVDPLFCFTGFFNEIGATKFVMLQGIAVAFLLLFPSSAAEAEVRTVRPECRGYE